LGFDEVTFHKNSPLKSDMASIKQLIKAGAVLTADNQKVDDFKKLGMTPVYSREDAIERASVVIDCTPKGFGLENKQKYYEKFKYKVDGFIAQGSESGFGTPFAYNINNSALNPQEQFVQVVSCNTHNISAIMRSFMKYHSVVGDFVCIRRASDISQNDDFLPGIEVDKHKYNCGTHHAVDARRIFNTIEYEANIYSSSCVVPTQYMHAIRFKLLIDSEMDLDEVLWNLSENHLVAFTEKNTSNSIFSFGRDCGYYGRILNQTVVSLPTLNVCWDGKYTHVVGYCFTPQDANSLLSSVAATLWLLYKDWHVVKEKMNCLNQYLFQEI
jgi:glyceraldehyde-3-phosphate dehydrogenase (NAD(P))